MAKTKQNKWLNLETDWMFQDPIDFEHKKYVLLNFLKKCDENLNNLKVYPTFIELSLHLANTQSLIKNNSIIYTEKILETVDDELMLMDLKYKLQPTFDNEEKNEIKKMINYSSNKLFDYFNLAKSIWSYGFDSVAVNVKKNKRYLKSLRGFICYQDTFNKHDIVWEYLMKKINKKKNDSKIVFNLIFSGSSNEVKLSHIIENNRNVFSSLDIEEINKLPIIQITSKENFPFEETLVPIFKRKLFSYLMQTVRIKEIPNS